MNEIFQISIIECGNLLQKKKKKNQFTVPVAYGQLLAQTKYYFEINKLI